MEHWSPLQDYPGYSASDLGRIRNDTRDRLMSVFKTSSGHMCVSMTYQGKQVTRSVAKLIASTFVQNPSPGRFDTPIHLNGDLSNAAAYNLMWRPRWFAMRFTRQFSQSFDGHPPIRNKGTGEIVYDCWDVVMRDGLLYNEILIAATNRAPVFPTWEEFEWVE